jgi:hypothetical protein
MRPTVNKNRRVTLSTQPLKATSKKKSTKQTSQDDIVQRLRAEGKRRERGERTDQLKKQYEYIKHEQKEGRATHLGRVIRGRGDYTVGRNIGSKVGGWIGDKLEGFVRQIFGSGDYQIQGDASGIQQNSLVQGSNIPAMHDTSLGAVSIKFHEFIGNIAMTSAFSVKSYPIDITQSTVFPWVNRIASNYQQWELAGCVFFLRSLSADTSVAPTQGMGAIYGSVRYDTASDAPTSKVDILNSTMSSSAKPSEHQAFPVECARAQTQVPLLKVLPRGAIVSANDLQMYMVGYFDLATEGAPNPYIEAAELYVTYDVRFFKPRVEEVFAGGLYMLDCLNSSLSQPFAPIPDTVAVAQPRFNNLGVVLAASKDRVTFPLTTNTNQTFQLTFTAFGSSVLANLAPYVLALSGGLVRSNAYVDQTEYLVSAPSTNTNTGCACIIVQAYFRYNGSGTASIPPTVSISTTGSALPATTKGSTLVIIAIPTVMVSGLTSVPRETYTRREFFQYLCDMIANRPSTSEPPRGFGRLGDWTTTLTRFDEWPVGKELVRSTSPFDQTFLEALAAISKYIGPTTYESKTSSSDFVLTHF